MAAVNRVNASNYVAAGKAAVNNSLVGLKSYRDNAPDYASLSETSRKARAAVKGAGMVAAGNMANTAASIAGEMQARKLKGKYDSAIAKEKKFAGRVAATGLLADDYLNPREPYQEDYSGYTDYLDQQEASIAKKQADVDNPEHTFGLIKPTMQEIPTFNTETTGPTNSSGSTNSSVPTSSQSLQQIIFDGESYGGDYGAFNLGGKDGGHTAIGSGKDSSLTTQTVQDVMNSGRFAQGAYQIIPSTMQGLMSGAYGDTGVQLTDKYDKSTQDKFFNALARNRVVPGDVDKTMAGLRNEWISLQNVSDDVLRPAVQSYMNGL